MHCPVCPTTTLDARHSHGIEVDVCPSCSGVWLDRGELDKIITQAQTEPALGVYEPPKDPSTSTEERVPGRRVADEDDRDESDHRTSSKKSESSKKSKKRRTKSFGDRLEDIFDDVLDLDLDDIFD